MKRYWHLFRLVFAVMWLETKRKYWDWRDSRAALKRERSPRPWTAKSPYGSVDLGTLTHSEALALVANLGRVSYVDTEHGLIFYDTQDGGPPPAGGKS